VFYQDENVLRAEFHLLWPNDKYRPDLDVLVAGCGTFQAAKHAIGHPVSRVVGIDVSSTSLEHTERLKQKHNLTNLETYLLPIERAHELDQRFDHIICTGVLHHLADPEIGLRALKIDEQERRMFEAIDGVRQVADIVDDLKKASALKAKEASRIARSFFEKLWRYDQVVFDTSQAS